MKSDGEAPLVLMYHRIAEPGLDPWRLSVTPKRFAKHLDVLCSEFNIVSSANPEDRYEARSVIITFDDGYADNLLVAQPILERCSAPATVFVTTDFLGGRTEYWWDELERLILLPGRLPKRLELDSVGIEFRFDMEEMSNYTAEQADRYRGWRVPYDGREPPTARHRLFLMLWELLGGCDEAHRREVLDFLNGWASTPQMVRDSHRPLSEHELIRLHRSGGIEIGSHGATHRSLPTLDADSKRIELESSKSKLETILNDTVTSFAYPHGEYDLETLRLAEEAGYRRAYAAGKPTLTGEWNRFRIPRMAVRNWTAEKFSDHLDFAFAQRKQVLDALGD